jgi:hypothetical protein
MDNSQIIRRISGVTFVLEPMAPQDPPVCSLQIGGERLILTLDAITALSALLSRGQVILHSQQEAVFKEKNFYFDF